MSVNRRSFIKNITLTALGAAMATKAGSLVLGQSKKRPNPNPSAGFPIPQSSQTDFLFYSSYDTFSPYVGSIFTARGANGEEVQLTLTAVTRYAPQAATRITTGSVPVTNCVSLMFSATGRLPEFSNIPTLHHPALGQIDMFLAYHGEGQDGYLYEAVINHLEGITMVIPIDEMPVSRPQRNKPSTAKQPLPQAPTVTPQKTTPGETPLPKSPRKRGIE
jgi:hypothetical protein